MRHLTIAPEPFDLHTGGKQPELAIAFNLACDNIDKYIKTLMNWSPAIDALKNIHELDDRAFVFLREYLWKGNTENKNTAGYSLAPADKFIILQLLGKLTELRNFHSHFWHTNSSINFGNDLRLFVQNKHDWACGRLAEERSIDAELYFKQQHSYPLFKNHSYITQEGRVFFLSFFLNKGQMQALLQRRKGSKRHDLPEYKFKHKVLTYYCHREGSSWLTTGIENSKLTTFKEEEQERIYSGRQANRILSYLKDRPARKYKEVLPLILSDGRWVDNMSSLLAFIYERNILPGFHFYEKATAHQDDLLDEKQANEEKKHQEKIQREGYRRFVLPDNPVYVFEINYSVLRRIVSDIFLDDSDPDRLKDGFSSRQHFIGVLKACIEARQYIYDNLKAAGDRPITPELYALKKIYSSIYIDYSEHQGGLQERFYTEDEWRAIPISPNSRVEKLLIEWHNSFTTGKESEYRHRIKLLNAIRPSTEPYETLVQSGRRKSWNAPRPVTNQEPEPLLFHLAYYFRELEANQRMEDQFLEWGVRYLIDMGIVPDWYFEIEKLVYEQKYNQPESPYKLKKELRWEKDIPDNYRLYITDNQLNIGTRQGDKFYRLRMGERLLKYLLFWNFHEPNKGAKSINNFLLTITRDVSRLQNSAEPLDLSGFQLMEAFAIPELYFKTKSHGAKSTKNDSESYKDQVSQFLLGKIKWIESQLLSIRRLNRSQKNEVLMDVYQLFDFSGTEGSKFLRKNEYAQMSICHYMLNQNKDKVRHLIEKTFQLKKRLPLEILQMLYSVAGDENGNLDQLCTQALMNRKAFLQTKLELLKIDGLKPRQIRKEVIGSLAIYFEDENLTEGELLTRKNARLDSISHLPFAVHPALALKYFYPEEFAAHGFRKESGEHRNIFLQLRKTTPLVSPLPADNYPEISYRKVQENYQARFPGDKGLDRYFKKWIGHLNETKVKDILLLQVAEKYLEKYDVRSAEEFRKIRLLKGMDLERLFNRPALIPLPIDQSVLADMDSVHKRALPRVIHLELRLHQADDYFYRSQKSKLYRLAVFFLNWRREEMERYREHPEILEQISLWPDGSREFPLTIGSLIEARKIIADQAAELAGHILNYEARVLNNRFLDMNKVEKQAALREYSGEHELGEYISFVSVQSWDLENSEQVKEKIQDLRNQCLHNAIPVNGSYRQQSLPGSEVAEALHIYDPLGKDRTEKSIYEVYEEKEQG